MPHKWDKKFMLFDMIKRRKKLEKPTVDVILDFETVDVTPTSAVLSLAILAFDPSECLTFADMVHRSLRIKFNINNQAPRRTINNDTVNWWKSDEMKTAYAKVVEKDGTEVDISELDGILSTYLTGMGYEAGNNGKIWARGNAFDNPILEDIYAQHGWAAVFPFWNYRCVRTEIDAITPYWDDAHKGYGYLRDEIFPKPAGMIKHIEVHDIAFDVMQMQFTHLKLMEKLGT